MEVARNIRSSGRTILLRSLSPEVRGGEGTQQIDYCHLFRASLDAPTQTEIDELLIGGARRAMHLRARLQ
jgi:hypothetical protein